MKHVLIFYDGPLAGQKMDDFTEYAKGFCRDHYDYTDESGNVYHYILIQETIDKFCYSLCKKKPSFRNKKF